MGGGDYGGGDFNGGGFDQQANGDVQQQANGNGGFDNGMGGFQQDNMVRWGCDAVLDAADVAVRWLRVPVLIETDPT